jgi:flagellar motor switch protein FliM
MSEIDDDSVKQWSLTLSDLISAKLKANISFKDFDSEEIIFNEFLEQHTEPLWTTLCEDSDNQHALMVTMNYTSIIASTNNFFSNSAKIHTDDRHRLSVTERFIANEISNDIIQAFEMNEMNIRFLRNESQLSLIRPFHEDESITIYKFNWAMNNDHYGELKLCHSHVL